MKQVWKVTLSLSLIAAVINAFQFQYDPVRAAQRNQDDTMQGYAALGDSIAAGVHKLESGTVVGCGQSEVGYPHTVARELSVKLHNYSCSGATIEEGILGSQTIKDSSYEPQIDQLRSNARPKLVTLTVGANDTEWLRMASLCYRDEGCQSEENDRSFDERISTLQIGLRQTLDQISEYAPESTIIVTGYYDLVNGVSTCRAADQLRINQIAWIHQNTEKLRSSVERTVVTYGKKALYAPVDFSGHDVCADDPWLTGFYDDVPIHPTPKGEEKIAVSVLRAYRASQPTVPCLIATPLYEPRYVPLCVRDIAMK